MRVVVQLVKTGNVKINKKIVGSIKDGFVLLVGFTNGDDNEIARKMAEKIIKLRVFPDENGKTNLSIDSVNGNVLSVSQFTLYGNTKGSNRPSFTDAMEPLKAKELYESFNNYLRVKFPNLQTGVFQADMEVELVNNGPFTLILDSKELF